MGSSKIRIVQNNFTGGEISPLLTAREDLVKHKNALAKMNNFIATPQGPAMYRKGFKYITYPRHGYSVNYVTKFIPFQFSEVQAYLIEFGHCDASYTNEPKYIRFYKNLQLITKTAINISGITKANPAVVTVSSTSTLTNGDRVIIKDVVGMTEVNNREFIVANKSTSPATFEIQNIYEQNVNSSSYSTYSSGGTVNPVYEITTSPYDYTQIPTLDYSQSADMLFLWHYDKAPRQLARTADTDWALDTVDFKHEPTYLVEYDISDSGDTANAGLTPLNMTGDDVLFYTSTNGTKRVFLPGDVGRIIKAGASRAAILRAMSIHVAGSGGDIHAVTGVSRADDSSLVTITTGTSSSYSVGNYVTIFGLRQEEYNGTFKVTAAADANHFTFDCGSKEPKKTPSISGYYVYCYKSPKAFDVSTITLYTDSTEFKITTGSAHGYTEDDGVTLYDCPDDALNGSFEIYDVTTTTFKARAKSVPTVSTPVTNTFVRKTSPTNVITADIIQGFDSLDEITAGNWTIEGSPSATLTVYDTLKNRAADGDIISIKADRGAFRDVDVDSYIKYLRSDALTYAIFKITKIIDSRHVKVKIISRLLKDDYPSVPTSGTDEEKDLARQKKPDLESGQWALETKDWTAARGYPTHGCFHNGRLWVSRKDALWGSKSDNYFNFNVGSADDSGISRTIGGQEVNVIQWLVSKGDLFIGTNGGEWRGYPSETGVITPNNLNIELQTGFGSYATRPEILPSGIAFVQKHGATIRELGYNVLASNEEGYMSTNLTIYAEHLFNDNIKRMAYQAEPYGILWVLLESGQLIGITYLKEHEIIACHSHTPSSVVYNDIAVIPGYLNDELWANVTRTLDGAPKNHIEVLIWRYE